MVEIFRTDVCCSERARMVLEVLHSSLPDHVMNFDLDDADKILRVESDSAVMAGKVIQILKNSNINGVLLS